MRNKYNYVSMVNITKAIIIALVLIIPNLLLAQANSQASSIQTDVSFQWEDTQGANLNSSATIKSITISGLEYNTFVVPTSYEMTRLGPDGPASNRIKLNGPNLPGNSSGANWITDATAAFQDKNLNHYFTANPNGRNICSDSIAALNTDAQKQTIFYSPSIPSNADAVLAVTERGANNCFYLEVWGTPAGGGPEEKLGATFVRNVGNYTGCTYAPPLPGSDYWHSGRCNENGQTVGIALFYLNDIAPTGSKITKIEFIAATRDHGDGKFFILQKYAEDQESTRCLNETFNGDLSNDTNVPDNSTYTLVSGPTPAGQSFTLNSNGTYEYIPSTGYIGDVNFSYEVCLPAPNSSVCDTGNVTMTFIDLPPDPAFTISCGSSYDDFIVTVDSPLGSEFEYSLNDGVYQDSPIFNDLNQGTYNLLVRNKLIGCTTAYSSNPVLLTPLELIGTTTDILCKGENTGAIDITVSGGYPPYTISWSNSATSEDIDSLYAGDYTVTITDTTGCSINETFTLNQPTEDLESSISATQILCNGDNTGTIDLTISGGTGPYTVLWNNNSTDEDLNNLIAGTYIVTITDANNCEITDEIIITEPTDPLNASVSSIENVDCSGSSTGSFVIEGSGGTAPYTYSVNNGVNTQSSGFFENLSDDSYTVLVTDANNCTFTLNVNIDTDDTEDPTISVPNAFIIEGCSTLDITSDDVNLIFNYSESQSGDIQSSFATNSEYIASDDASIQSITYIDITTSSNNCPLVVLRTFTVTDDCGNTASATQTITVEDTTPPTITAPADVTIECTDDESSA
ncbi:Ig-like domain-containing protein, partial [Winogradskyella sp. PE311]|uniref:Ig-like domain-containing protein n=1 Tax=Winogradskyella sp. PE311 TaxID=3366943 RepID=UPI0039811F9C